jgi:hypothetical protein
MGIEIMNNVPLGAIVAVALTAGVLIATAVADKKQRFKPNEEETF